MKHSLRTARKGLTLAIDNTDQTRKLSAPQSRVRRREDRELKKEAFSDLPLYGPGPNKLPWEFLRAA